MRTAVRALVAVGAALATPAAAQEDSRPLREVVAASPLLPPGHWAVGAAHRAEALGLAPGFFPAQGAASRAEVAAALRAAAADTSAGSRGALAQAWLGRFLEEFPGERARGGRGLSRLGGGVGLQYGRDRGRLAPVRGIWDGRGAPLAIPPHSAVSAEARLGVRVGEAAAGWAAVTADRDGVRAELWEGVVGGGGLALAAVRGPIRYGAPSTEGLVLSSAAALPRLELRTVGPWQPLRLLGSVTAHTFLTPLREDRHPTEPWLWGARVAVRPHRRVTLALNRASIFGGDSVRVTPARVGGMLVGILTPGFENQVVSVDGRYRLPTEGWLPLVAYAEWGAEDGAGAWWEQPARLFGLEAPAFPGAPHVALAVEGVWFPSCCGHGAWYQHAEFTGHWVARERPLGHPVGGEGGELALRAAADLADARLRLRGRGFLRRRSHESLERGTGGGNLFSPARSGRSAGGAVEGMARLAPWLEASLHAAAEQGSGWRESTLTLELRSLF